MKYSHKSHVRLGILPTHVKFVGGLVPNEDGTLPRNSTGQLVVVEAMEALLSKSPAPIEIIQIPAFPGIDDSENDELVSQLQKLVPEIHLIMMVGGADPMKAEDEDAIVDMLSSGINLAKRHGVRDVGSTSIEEWLQGSEPKTGEAFEAAVAQNVRAHKRVYDECQIADSCIEHWHIEFLRKGEFQTFTNIGACWEFVKAANAATSSQLFQVLIDSAHCGDSGLSMAENVELIEKVATEGGFSMFHGSAKTTRGCYSTDDGWIGSILEACAKTGKLETAFVELFHHEDDALEGLRNLNDGHGTDTTEGRSYEECVLYGIEELTLRLNNLANRGILPSR